MTRCPLSVRTVLCLGAIAQTQVPWEGAAAQGVEEILSYDVSIDVRPDGQLHAGAES